MADTEKKTVVEETKAVTQATVLNVTRNAILCWHRISSCSSSLLFYRLS